MESKEFTVFIEPAVKKGGMPRIEIPPEVADHFLGSEKNKERMVISFDNGKKFHRALQRNKDGFSYMVLGKTTLKEARKEPGTEQRISLEVDTSKYGMPMPEELEEVMRQDSEGEKAFEKLKPGLKRSFLYYINGGKTVETRIQRSLKMIDNLKNGFISAGKYDAGSRG